MFLVLAGLGLGALPGVPEIEVDPDVIFLVFLPPLIHAAAWTTPHRQLRDNAVPVTLLAIGNVAIAISAVGYLASFFPWLSSTAVATTIGVIGRVPTSWRQWLVG